MKLQIALLSPILGLLCLLELQSACSSEQAQIPINERGSWGYINSAGQTVLGPKYDHAEPFKNGFASVCPTGNSLSDTSFRTIITTHGKTINPLLFFEPGPMSDGFAVVHTPFIRPAQPLLDKVDVRATYVNTFGQIQSKRFHVCGNYSNGVAVCGIFGPNKNAPRTPQIPKLSGIKATFADGYDQGPYKFTYFLIDRNQMKLAPITGIPVDKPPLGLFSFSQGKMRVKVGGKYGFIDQTGKLIIQPRFEECSNFHEGMAAVRLGQKWGFVNETGNLSIPCSYKRVSSFSDGLAKVETDTLSGFIHKNNKMVFRIESFDNCSDFSEGLAIIGNSQGSVFLDKRGRTVYRTARSVGTFHEGLCVAVDVRNSHVLYGYLDKQFKWAIQPQFVKAQDFSEGFAAVCFYDAKKETQEKLHRLEVRESSRSKYILRE